MEAMLKQILEKVTSLEEGQERLAKEQQEIKKGQDTFAGEQQEIKKRMDTFAGEQQEIKKRMDTFAGEQQEIKHELREIKRKVNIIYEQTANLTEFGTEITQKIDRHDIDIRILKQLIAK